MQQNSPKGKNYRLFQYVQYCLFTVFLHRFSYIQLFLENFSNTHIEMLVEGLRVYVQIELINCSSNFEFLLFIGLLIEFECWVETKKKKGSPYSSEYTDNTAVCRGFRLICTREGNNFPLKGTIPWLNAR